MTSTTSVRNYEGAPAFERPLRERLVQTVTVGVFGNTFYASQTELDAQGLATLLEARDSDPEFLAKAAAYGRSVGLLKDAPVKALAVLASGRGRTKPHFERAFSRVIGIPDDLRLLAQLLVSGAVPGKKGLGGYAAEAAGRWVANVSEYHAIKYGSARTDGVSLRDVVRMTHPKAATEAAGERLAWLVRGAAGLGTDPRLNPKIRALEALKGCTDEDRAVELVREGRLPFEVVVPALPRTGTKVWRELFYQAPYMNLLRNLATFTRHGVFTDQDSVRRAAERLQDPAAVASSKVLPFRLFDAWKQYTELAEADSRIADALRAALDLSLVNVPSFGNRTVAIGSDVSGSMSWGKVSDRGATRYIDICGILTAALLRQVEERAIVLPFDGTVHPSHGLSPRMDCVSIAERLARFGGGATAVGAPIEHLLRLRLRVDVFVGITDSVDWAYGDGWTTSSSFLKAWRRYRREVNGAAQAFLLHLAPYRGTVAPADEPGVRYVYGWSPAVPRYIPLMLDGGASQLDEVGGVALGADEQA